MKKLNYELMSQEIEESITYLKRVLKECKSSSISDWGFLFEMAHIYWHLNSAVNARHLSCKVFSEGDYDDFIKWPSEIELDPEALRREKKRKSPRSERKRK